LIAGGNSGMGLETVKLFQHSNHHLLCAARSHSEVSELRNVSMVPFYADSEADSLDLPDTLEGFVYFPGTITLKPFQRLTEEEFRQDLEVNFFGAVRLLQKAFPALKKAESASVVLFSTVAVSTGMPFHASIASAKGAVEGLARSLAAELAPSVRVNCIAPSLTDTKLASGLLDTEAKQKGARDRHPLKRFGNASENARLVQYLLSDDSAFMTGQVLRPDGGLSSLRTFS